MPARQEELSGYGRFGILMIIIGALLAVDSLLHLAFLYRLWPLIITLLGIGFIGIFQQRIRKEPPYLAIGVYLICFSGLALYCSLTTWAALGRLWPLFIVFLGLSFLASFYWHKTKRVLLLLGLLLSSIGVAFYFIFTIDPHLWWTIFLLGGISILITEQVK